MTIVDKVHAAEMVTKKGKAYKFDASECMINFLVEFDNSEVELLLTNNYTEPEVLIDATKATFLISENVPSPMGAFLSAFEIKAEAEKVQSEKGGQLYTWDELLAHFNR
jgi:copper chaperone NosL